MKFLTVALLIVLTVQSQSKPDFMDGLNAYGIGDYAIARLEWQRSVERANPHAQFALGSLYEQGQGVEQDYSEAANWYARAAGQGHALAVEPQQVVRV